MSAIKAAAASKLTRKHLRPGDVLKVVEPAPPPRFNMIPIWEIKLSETSEWLVKGLIPLASVGIVYGASQTYKSFLMVDLGLSIAAGLETWAGKKIKHPGAVVYICAEGAGGINRRLVGAREKLGIAPDHRFPFYVIPGRMRLGIEEGDRDELIRLIKSVIPEGTKVAAVIVDTMSQCLGGGKENSEGTQTFIGNVTDIAQEFQCTTIAVHHPGKSDEKDPRGHSSITNNPDFLWFVENDGDKASRITLKKMKDGDRDTPLRVTVKKVVLGVDEDGEDIDTLVLDEIAETEAKPTSEDGKRKRYNPNHDLIFDLMLRITLDHALTDKTARAELKADADATAPTLEGVSEQMVRDKWLKEMAGSNADPKEVDRVRKIYERARDSLIASKKIRRADKEGRSYLCDIRSKK